MDNQYIGQKNAILRQIQFTAHHQGRPLLTARGALFDFGDGSDSHNVILEHVQDLHTGKTYAGGTVQITGLRFEPAEVPRGPGAPRKQERNVALALAFEWFTAFFNGDRKLDVKASKSSAYKEVMDMWEANQWPGAANESALKKNIKKGAEILKETFLLTYIAPIEYRDRSFIVSAMQEDFDIHPHQRMRFNGLGWVWNLGQERARYGRLSIPETNFL